MFIFFFFKQKAGYGVLRRFVGSEMGIRDRGWAQSGPELSPLKRVPRVPGPSPGRAQSVPGLSPGCPLSTPDAADEQRGGDLGGPLYYKKQTKSQ